MPSALPRRAAPRRAAPRLISPRLLVQPFPLSALNPKED